MALSCAKPPVLERRIFLAELGSSKWDHVCVSGQEVDTSLEELKRNKMMSSGGHCNMEELLSVPLSPSNKRSPCK